MTLAADSVATWLGDFLLLSTLLLVFVLLSQALLRQPAHRLAVAKGALVAVALLAVLCGLPRASLVHLVSTQSIASPLTIADGERAINVESDVATQPLTAPAASSPASTASISSDPRTTNAPLASRRVNWFAVLIVAYVLGAVAVAAWLVLGIIAAHRLRQTSMTAPKELRDLLIHLDPQTTVELRITNRITVPVALGILRPTILVPHSATADQSVNRDWKSAMEPILAHELAHIRNHDLAWLAASRALLVLQWGQPLYWVLRRRMRLDQEALADAAAAERTSRQQYAEQLVAWARRLAGNRPLRMATAMGLWEGASQLRERIALLIDERIVVACNSSMPWQLGVFFACTVGTAVLSLVTLAPASSTNAAAPTSSTSGKVKVTLVQETTQPKNEKTAPARTPTLLSYGDGKADGKKSYGGSGHLIAFELPEGVTKVKGIRIHASRYGYPQAPDEDAEITFLSEGRDEVLHTEAAPYKLFKRGKENWVRVMFEKEIELPQKFWIALDFNAEQTKGVYVSYDTSTKGVHSRVGKAGDEEEPKETDFKGDWMVQVILSPPAK